MCEIRTSDLCMDMLCSVEQKKEKPNYYFGYLLIHMQRCLYGAEVFIVQCTIVLLRGGRFYLTSLFSLGEASHPFRDQKALLSAPWNFEIS